MKQPREVANQISSISTIVSLTNVFEGIASMKIAQIKDQVQQAQEFFDRLWQVYTQIRVDAFFHFGRRTKQGEIIKKELFIAITGEGGFSGDIDQKLITWMLGKYDATKQDIIVIGHHGAIQLVQSGVKFQKYFKLPEKDQNINVMPIVQEVQGYMSTRVFYQTYVSLMVQDVKCISLSTAVEEKGRTVEKSDEIISEDTYIFEPSTFAVVDHLERSMLNIALSQLILESKLAQYASRFRAMTAAHSKSKENLEDLTMQYSRVRRMIKDERLKEVVNGLRMSQQGEE